MTRNHTEAEMMEKVEQIENEMSDNYTCDRNISSIVLETPSYHDTKNDNIVVYLNEGTLRTTKADIVNFFLVECSVPIRLDTMSGKEYDHLTFELIKE